MMTQKEYLARFKQLTAQMYYITSLKNSDYAKASDAFKNFRKYGAFGILVRMSDKFARLDTAIVEKRQFKVNESLRDTALDLAVYSLILICYMEENRESRRNSRTHASV